MFFSFVWRELRSWYWAFSSFYRFPLVYVYYLLAIVAFTSTHSAFGWQWLCLCWVVVVSLTFGGLFSSYVLIYIYILKSQLNQLLAVQFSLSFNRTSIVQMRKRRKLKRRKPKKLNVNCDQRKMLARMKWATLWIELKMLRGGINVCFLLLIWYADAKTWFDNALH